MIIFPAIDLRDGRCVRLTQGRFDQEIVYGDPREAAKLWVRQGAKYLHLVDLDAALSGHPQNGQVIREIVDMVPVPVQVGGGLRSIEAVESMMAAGVTRVIIGTSAIADREFLTKAVQNYKHKIVVSIDARDGIVALRGWTELSGVKALDLAKDLELLGVKTIVYTDIARDGMLSGPNFQELRVLKENLGLDIIASGGISTAKDVAKLRELGLAGAIIGKALYTGDINLAKLEEI